MRDAHSFGNPNSFPWPLEESTLRTSATMAVAVILFVTGTMLAGCSGKGNTVAPRNLPPSINAIQLVPPRAAPGDTITASAIAGDPEGKPLVFRWRSNTGTFVDSTGQSIRWIAPSAALTCSLTVRVSDGVNEASMSRAFPVGVGYLVVESYPQGATLLIDSQQTVLTTPVTISNAPAGDYTLQVERSPYVYSPGSVSVEVANGDITRVRFKLNDGMMYFTQLTSSDCITQSSWSPNGAHVVCAVQGTSLQFRVLYVFSSPWPDLLGDVVQTGDQPNWGPSWSPADTAILFASSRTDGVNRIYRVPVSEYSYGGTASLVYGGASNFPVWSPDASKIAFVTDEGGSFSLRVMPSSGGVAAPIATGVLEDRPSWSPDGNYLAFSKMEAEQPSLFSVPSAGGAPVKISEVPGIHPNWSPDGNRIAFVSSSDGTENVWILFLNATPSPVEGQLTSTGASWPAWAPGGASLCFTIPGSQPGCHNLWSATHFPF